MNVLLVLLLAFQTFVWWRGSLPAPSFLETKIRERVSEEGLRIDFSALRLETPDRLSVESLRLESLRDPGLAVEADFAAVRLSPESLLRGELRVQSVLMDAVRVTCPPALSHSGTPEALVNELYLRASGNDREWRIDELVFRSGDLTATLRGSLPALPEEPPPEAEEPPWADLLAQAATEASRIKGTVIDGIDDGCLRVDLGRRYFDRLAVEARISARHYRHPAGVGIDGMVLNTAFLLDGRYVDGSFELRADAASYRDEGAIENIAARGSLPRDPLSGNFLPGEARLAAETLSALGENAENLYVTGTQTSVDRVEFAAYLAREGRPVSGTAQINVRTGEGRLEASADVNPTAILRNEHVRDAGFRFDVSFETAPELDATLHFGPAWEPRRADLKIRTGPCLIDGVPLDAATATARWTPGIFDVSEMVLHRDDFRVAGSYRTDTDTRDYRFQYAGTLRPAHLAPWFGDWWEVLWEPFEFAGPPPVAGIEIEGRWRDDTKLALAGWARGEDLLFRGVALDRISANYFVTSTATRVSDARITGPGGSVEGGFVFRRDGERAVEFEAAGTLEPGAAGRLIGEGAERVLAPFTFEAPPEIRLSGRLEAPGNGGFRPENKLAFTARSDTPLTFHGIPLGFLALDGRLDGSILTLDEIDGGFADGELRGSLRVDLAGEGYPLEGSFSLRDAAFGPGLASLANHAHPDASDDERENLRELGGLADLDVEAEGRLHDRLSFDGGGEIHIREAALGRVRLLGLLSRILDRTPLRFTSLQIDEAESSFQLQKETIRFPDLRMTGPNVGLEASGDYHLTNDALDFRVKLFPLRESPVPLVSTIFGRILAPFGHILEMSLTGTLDDPQWRLPFDPRRPFDESPESIESR